MRYSIFFSPNIIQHNIYVKACCCPLYIVFSVCIWIRRAEPNELSDTEKIPLYVIAIKPKQIVDI